ncbi:MAG: hypothetical protein WCF85_05920 [Rhodospirillaceae bacterium]
MDAFIRKYSSFLTSLSYLLLGLGALSYSVVISPMMVANADLAIIRGMVDKESGELRAFIAERKKLDKPAAEVVRSLPIFLRNINSVAQQTKVIIRELSPSREGGLKFVMKILTDYRTFLDFISKLEALDVILHDIQVRPYDPTKKPPQHFIEFSLTPRQDAQPLDSARIALIKAAVAAPDSRNPFQRFAYDQNSKVKQEIDLTWIYKLSGLGRVGDERVATIDSKDYRKGDPFDGMVIVSVDADRVSLEKKTERGTDRYVIKFRIKK